MNEHQILRWWSIGLCGLMWYDRFNGLIMVRDGEESAMLRARFVICLRLDSAGLEICLRFSERDSPAS